MYIRWRVHKGTHPRKGVTAQDAHEKLGKHAEWVGKEAVKVN